MIPNSTGRKNDLLTVPQQFPCRDEAECQKTGLFSAPFAEQHCPDAVARASWLQIHCQPGRVLENWLKKKKIKKQLSGCRRKMPASPCAVGDAEEERSIPVAAVKELQCPWSTLHMVHFYRGSPVENYIINMWWLKAALPDSHVVNHVLQMNKHSSLSSPVV